jgi:long-chain fatty acid transport protein
MNKKSLRGIWSITGNFAIFLALATACRAESIVPSVAAKSAGRGGANLAFDDNGFLLHDNPSGLLGVFEGKCACQRNFVDVNLAGLFPDLEYSDPQNSGVAASNDPFGMGAFTIGRRVSSDLALGFGVYSPAGFGARWNLEGPPGALSGPQFYKSLGMLVRVLPGFSYQATDRLRVGANLGVAVSHVELEGPYIINAFPLTGTPTNIDIQSTGAALSWATGLQYQATDRITLAARYQSQNRFQNGGNARIDIFGLGSSAYDMKLDIVWPRSAGVGLQYAATSQRRYGLDVDWQQWSRAKDEIGIHFTDPDNPVFLMVAGPEIREALPLRWRDNVVIRSGVEQDLSNHQTVRFGYGFNSDANRGATTSVYLPTVLMHYFSTGYTLQRKAWEYNVAYQYSFRPTIHIQDSTLAGDDFANGSLRTQAHWLFLGAARSF